MLGRLLRELYVARQARSASGRRELEKEVLQIQRLLGIGGGTSVTTSGEHAVVDLLRVAPPAGRPLCILDVGANTGQFLRLVRERLDGLDWLAHCFEPSAAAFAGLRESAGALPDTVLNAFGLGKAAGEFDLHADSPGSGLASLSRRRLDHYGIAFGHVERIRLETLDAYCEQRGLGQVDLLKLDVEGHELGVLEGGARMFAERRVRRVAFEFGGCNIDSRCFLQDFWYFFAARGMRAMYRVLPGGALDLVPAYSEALEQFRVSNFLVLLGDCAPLAPTA